MSCRFEREVSKWDESSNDIVVLAKEMCMMMMDMSDFTRYISDLPDKIDYFSTTLCAVGLKAPIIGIIYCPYTYIQCYKTQSYQLSTSPKNYQYIS